MGKAKGAASMVWHSVSGACEPLTVELDDVLVLLVPVIAEVLAFKIDGEANYAFQ